MSTWITTDTHYNHPKLIEWGRPEDFEKKLDKGFRAHIKPGDTLIHLGDVCIGKDAEQHQRLMDNLPGVKKILVRGNHDHKSNNWYLNHGWDFVCDAFVMMVFGKRVLFTHVPSIKANATHFNPDFNLHGHYHGLQTRRNEVPPEDYDHSYYYDCAPDTHKYQPLLLDRVVSKLINKTNESKDQSVSQGS